MRTIGFVGTGVMGASMARNIVSAGYSVRVYNRTPAKAASLARDGAAVVASLEEVARGADAVVTMVGLPADVEEVYLRSDGLLATMRAGSIAIDMTTSEPALAERLAAAGLARGIDVLDAPVSGGDVGARDGTLSIMVGGEPQAFARAEPLLRTMGSRVVLQGGPGAGQHTKMANQIAIASCIVGVMESLRYAETAGLDPRQVRESISGGAAGSWTMSNLAPRALEGDFAPGFQIRHFVKDLDIAAGEARRLGLDLGGLRLARDLYRECLVAGWGEEGTQALFKRA
jgi:3-hydroxyisobutyrate dehydrogenase